MNIFIISQGQDTGGQGQRISAAFRKYTDWEVNAMCAAETYIKFPIHHLWDLKTARKFYDEADVVEHQNWLYGYAMYEHGDRKPTIVRHHGSPLRGNADEANKEARSIGATQVVSTSDLLYDAPDAIWTPGFYDLDFLSRKYIHRPQPTLRIGHGPTVREAKGTDRILSVLDTLSKRYKFEVDLIEKVSWVESLRRKARCDIWIDQITLGYGGSTIEAMAMSIPVVSGWDDELDRLMFTSQIEGSVPFHHATTVDLEQRIEELIVSKQLREEIGHRGWVFAQQWHSEERGIKQLQQIYRDAKPSLGIEHLWLHNEMTVEQVRTRYENKEQLRRKR